ncbi:urea carboxylase [Emcibacter nanhaiensis]|uniref:Urea carboxylase n=1 Tax=Emcibacter nanhaiensis TaxID=1505037 RepID=A0A501PA02_9PROT|nr:urea carboxylase [Emcibacter nanhaiensis]TPD56847.1 urea carboxylase [Emcibacter nanhaiensis]
MFSKVLIANRGVIACRIIRTLKKMGVQSVAVYTEADATSAHVRYADEAIYIGGPEAANAYLDGDKIIEAAKAGGAEAIHPGYGFLSENAGFAEACAAAGIEFIGPTPDTIRLFGRKHTARELAQAAGAPLMPGSGLLENADQAAQEAENLGYPVMLKATAGGGGIGMRVCEDRDDLLSAFDTVQRQGQGSFGDGGVFLERYVRHARHVEVQIFGDGGGNVVVLGDRDCSLQRRNQKVIEETPAPNLPTHIRDLLWRSAGDIAAAACYRSAGTVEFLYDVDRETAYFLEVNTRLQVEHAVTEEVTGVDLVDWMVRGASGDFSVMEKDVPARGAAIQARVYAEDPSNDYMPSAGLVTDISGPKSTRFETYLEPGVKVSAHYDPMLGKIVASGPDRASALEALETALTETTISGLTTNLEWLKEVVSLSEVVEGKATTRTLEKVAFQPQAMRILSGGPSTTVQDAKGRLGYWHVGVPPSGAMDFLSLRLANRLLGNSEDAAGLEFTAMGPAIRFECASWICLGGADFAAELNGKLIRTYQAIKVTAGDELVCGRVNGAGLRGYLAVAGGIAVPEFMGSRATFTLGEFGGHAGRALAAGDLLPIKACDRLEKTDECRFTNLPSLEKEWIIRVTLGPHSSPDFFTDEDVDMLLAANWKVHFNSSRTGVRLVGPKPDWARKDGGEAGLHPSNIHDNAYAIGAVDFTGDMPILLGPDGPSLGGFVCPFVTITADLWKLGQLAPGDRVSFQLVDDRSAREALFSQENCISNGSETVWSSVAVAAQDQDAILHRLEESGERPAVTYRRQGDANLLVEYGPIVLDLELRARIHALMLAIEERIDGLIEVTPGVRSLQIHFDPLTVNRETLIDKLVEIEETLGDLSDFEATSRVVHLPLSWEDPHVQQTIDKYMRSVRDDAPWCPDNIEFIRRVNGLESREDVYRTVFDADYLVIGLGDVYLGAPLATPMDPRHRLVTTKYNPARTWTPPNVVGIGGAYLCIYGMEGPGGYQLFGRTVQVWNSWSATGSFEAGCPWLLRFFDRIKFYEVSAEELAEWRREFPLGRRDVKIEEDVFRMQDYRAFLEREAGSIAEFRTRREAAFARERDDWEAAGEFSRVAEMEEALETEAAPAALELPENAMAIETPLSGVVWKIHVEEGVQVTKGHVLASVEAMKMEQAIASPCNGVVIGIYAAEGSEVTLGSTILAVKEED